VANHHGAGVVAQGDRRPVTRAEIARTFGDDRDEVAEIE